MTGILEGDPFAIGLTGYTREEGEAVLRGEPVGGVETPAAGIHQSCRYRGGLIEIGSCDLCGIKGQPFEVLQCDLHGECSLRRRHSKIRSCCACPDRESVATGDPLP